MSRKPIVFALVGAMSLALAGTASAQNRVSASQKGSLLMFSKVEIKWDDADPPNLIQDTFLDFTNDWPADVFVQAYFINGDTELEQICSGEPCDDNIIQEFEPGWNTANCRFVLTADQPHFWSAATGSDKCQAFTVLDGDGRPDPESGMVDRVLRGYVVMWAVDFIPLPSPGPSGIWLNVRWNHLKGDGLIVNYRDGSAWEYNAWAFRATTAVAHGAPLGPGGFLALDGGMYDVPFGTLLLDFYASGSTALSRRATPLGGALEVMVDTDLTAHAVSLDLRQDGCGPVLTKIEAEIWNEFETKFSGTRRCICCWDQTMLSDWVRSVAIPNHFTSAALRTDKGKARLEGVGSNECDYWELCGPSAWEMRWMGRDCIGDANWSQNAALLGLATKFLAFEGGAKASAGMNLVGMGTEPAYILHDIDFGPDSLQGTNLGRPIPGRGKTIGSTSGRNAAVRDVVEFPSE